MDQTQLSNPENMESSAEMASTQMNNRSMPNQFDPTLLLSGARSHSQQTNRSHENHPSYYQIQDGQPQLSEANHYQTPPGAIETSYFQGSQSDQASQSQTHQLNPLQCRIDGVLHSQQTNPLYQSQIDQSNSLLSTSGGARHSQQPYLTQTSQSQTDNLNFRLQPINGGMMHSQQTNPLYQSQIDQSNSLPSASGVARHSEQPHLTQTSLSQTDNLNFLLQPIIGGMMHSQQTSQPPLSEACQSQNQLNSLQPTIGGARHPQQPQLTAQCQPAQLNFLHSASGGMMHSQQTSQPRLSEVCQSQNQLNSPQPTSGGVRNSQQSQLNRECQSQTDQLNSPHYTSGTVMQFRETRQLQLTQREPSHDSKQTKSRSGKPLSNSQSAVNSRVYRDRKRQREKNILDENEFLKKELHHCKGMRHGSSSASVASLPRDHDGTNSREVDQEEINDEAVRGLRMRRDNLAVLKKLLSTGRPLSEQARQSTIEQLQYSKFSAQPTAADGFQITDHHETEQRSSDQVINGSQMSNNDHNSQKTVSNSSGGVVGAIHHAKNQENSQARTTLMADRLSNKVNANDITDKGENARRGAKGGYGIDDWMKRFDKGMTSDGERQSQFGQGKGAQDSKLKAPSVEGVEMPLKRHRDVDASPSTASALVTEVTASKSIKLSVELLETDSAFDSASVAHKIFASMLPPADEKRMNVPSSDNARNCMHHAWLAMAHAVKVVEQTKQIEHEYHKQIITLNRDLEKVKSVARGFQLEIEGLKAKVKENEAKRQANQKNIARRTFKLCINEVQHIHPTFDLSRISMDDLKTVRDDDGSEDGNGEGDSTTNTKVIVVETDAGNNDHDHHV